MTARTIVEFINAPASALPSLKRRMVRIMLHVVLIGIVTLTSILIGTIISSILLSGVE
jgi:putative Mn2+ efflux pump MntP